jgi:hypothetical protein
MHLKRKRAKTPVCSLHSCLNRSRAGTDQERTPSASWEGVWRSPAAYSIAAARLSKIKRSSIAWLPRIKRIRVTWILRTSGLAYFSFGCWFVVIQKMEFQIRLLFERKTNGQLELLTQDRSYWVRIYLLPQILKLVQLPFTFDLEW